MKKGTRIIITKVSDDVFDGNHPNGINEGYEKNGIMGELKVGMPFTVSPIKLSDYTHFYTSIVTEIIDENTFKTMNSTYKIVDYDTIN